MRSFCRLAAMLALLPLMEVCASGQSNGYTFTEITLPNAYPTAINDSGQVAGVIGVPIGQSSQQAFVLNQGAYTLFSIPGGYNPVPSSITNSGKVYGTYYQLYSSQATFEYDISTGLITTAGVTAPISVSFPTGVSSYTLSSVDPNGVAIGYESYTILNWENLNVPLAQGYVGFTYANGQATTIPNPSGDPGFFYPRYKNLSGGLVFSDTSGTFVSSGGTLTPVPLTPDGIGPLDQIVGSTLDSSGHQHGALFQDGVLIFIDDPNAPASPDTNIPDAAITGINSSGTVIGTYYIQSTPHGFIATPPTAPAGEKTRVYLDKPSSAGAQVSGTYSLAGWATDDTAGINTVSIKIDGQFVGIATYGNSRPDVCAVYPNQVGCPNVGWTYSLDTPALVDGTHTLEATATSINGTHASVGTTIQVANVASPSTIQMYIDSPAGQNSTLSGTVTFSGWAFDPNNILSSVQFVIDPGTPPAFYNFNIANFGLSRPDVCNVFGSPTNCLNSGWSGTFDTTTLSNGKHTLAVTAYENLTSKTLTTSFNVSNSGPARAHMDQPTANSTVSGTIQLRGWAEDDNVKGISPFLLIDGTSVFRYPYPQLSEGAYRPDVCAVFSQSPDCPNVGWEGTLDTTQLTNGTHTLAVGAFSSYYEISSTPFYQSTRDTTVTQPITVNVQNKFSAATTHVYIDSPTAASFLWNEATVTGWALDDNTSIENVDISVDGSLVASTYPELFGGTFLSRPDVCVVYPNRPGCPNVGWTVQFDTTYLTNGVHTLTATAFSSGGSQASVSTSFNVANFNGGWTKIHIDTPNSQSGDFSGQATFSGWAINNDYQVNNLRVVIIDLSVLIDGEVFSVTTTGLPRTDICADYPDAAGCPNIGWSIPVDTTLLSNGVHTLKVTAAAGSYPYADAFSASTMFTVNNSASNSPIKGYIDIPNLSTKALSGVASFSGWAADSNNSIAEVSIAVDGSRYGDASYGMSRPDVCAVFSTLNGCPAANFGWNFAIDTTLLTNGSHTLDVTETSSDGTNQTISKTFMVSN